MTLAFSHYALNPFMDTPIFITTHSIFSPKNRPPNPDIPSYFYAQDPLQSGLPLSDGRWLRASDLYLKYGHLDGSVVTLSGCSSGRGRVMGNDVLGLTSTFLYAGATAVVTGLWQVDDAATSLLMNSFYLQLRRETSVAEALQCAQLDLLRNPSYNHPYYWSPFQLNGDNPTITV